MFYYSLHEGTRARARARWLVCNPYTTTTGTLSHVVTCMKELSLTQEQVLGGGCPNFPLADEEVIHALLLEAYMY